MPYKDPTQLRSYLRQYHEKRIAYIKQAKAKPCADCKIEYPYYVMTFDHVRGIKVGNINEMVTRSSIRRLAEEIAKCDVVCFNCHAERTQTRARLVE